MALPSGKIVACPREGPLLLETGFAADPGLESVLPAAGTPQSPGDAPAEKDYVISAMDMLYIHQQRFGG